VHSFISLFLLAFDNTTPIYLINLLWKLGLRLGLDLELHYFRICNFILLLIIWVHSFSKMLSYKICSFSLFSAKNAKIVQL